MRFHLSFREMGFGRRRPTQETRRITYTLAQRVPELAPPHGPETVAEEPEGTDDAPPDRGYPETGVQRRSWLYRFFFGP